MVPSPPEPPTACCPLSLPSQGGCARFPNLCERLKAELRPLVAAHLPLNITIAADPTTYNWRAAAHVSRSGVCPVVTKAQYDEVGPDRCNDVFREW